MSGYDHSQNLEDRFLSRHDLLGLMGSGFAMLGLASVLGGEGMFAHLTQAAEPLKSPVGAKRRL